MSNAPAAKKPSKPQRASTADSRDSAVSERARIQNAMRKWQKMDEPASLLGRGLGRTEIIVRVAREVGATQRQVHSALKRRTR